VESVEIDEDGARAILTVKDDQLSLAIGKGGLNAKLASELTGTDIDIVSVSELEASERETRAMLSSLPGISEENVEELMSLGIWSYDNILDYGVDGMVETLGIARDLAERIHGAAAKFASGEETPSYLRSEEETDTPREKEPPEQEAVAESEGVVTQTEG
jgi:N utilization substance protein A